LTAGQIIQFIGKEGPSTKFFQKRMQKQFLRRDDVELPAIRCSGAELTPQALDKSTGESALLDLLSPTALDDARGRVFFESSGSTQDNGHVQELVSLKLLEWMRPRR